MRNPINIDDSCNQAIRQEIGRQLRVYLRVEPRLSASLKKQIARLYESEGRSPPIVSAVERGFKNEPRRKLRR
jgi:hypothetical protein